MVTITINSQDALSQWGVVLTDDALSALLAPAPVKDYITNKNASENGKQVASVAPLLDERDITLPFYLYAPSKTAFLSRLAGLSAVLHAGDVVITTSVQPAVKYKCKYISCTQFSQFNGKMAKFSLRLNEPNPANRN